VPEKYRQSVANFIKSRGMACSVYGAQYLMEGLYLAGKEEYAFDLLVDKSDRSWWHMIEVGSTITLEAWDIKYKGNMDWNHAWGAVPANIIPRYLMGVRPLEPGFSRILIHPQPGKLEHARAKIPTIRGTVNVIFQKNHENSYRLEIDIPANTTAKVVLPCKDIDNTGIKMDGKIINAKMEDEYAVIDPLGSGKHVFVT
ncbi:Bacterial alpha-L-rhamnosidase, partial [Candidatus Poribacteria bacterium]|nr:Bacterial alpha-L-rhamnosidase [Candidatus Poribacteria bacterium]